MSLIAWYPLVNGNKRNLAGGNDLNAYGTLGSGNGILGPTCSFTGSQYLYDRTSFTTKSNMSFATWVNFSATPSGMFVLDFRDSNGAGYQPLYISSPTVIQVYGGSSAATSNITHGKTLTTGKWYHLCVTIDSTGCTLFIDGTQCGTGTVKGTTIGTAAYLTLGRRYVNESGYLKGMLADVRIYDHTLSKKEVKEISKAKILDYSFDNDYMESGIVNYAPYPTPGTSATNSYAWDKTLHADAINVSGWGVGYNGGVSGSDGTKNPEVGYHAMWQLIDGLPTMVFNNMNTQYSSPRRWIGISGSISEIKSLYTAGKKYTISFDARADVEGMNIYGGMYYNNGTSTTFHDSQYSFNLTKTWKRYSKTFTVGYTASNNPSMYVYGHGNAIEGTSYVRNIQFEFNDHATPYTRRTKQHLIIDNSGYERNGTPNNIDISTTTNHGVKSAYFAGATSFIQLNHFKNDLVSSPFTFSFWVNPSESGTRDIYFGDYASTDQIKFNIERTANNYLRVYFNGDTLVGEISAFTIPANTWTHVCLTYNGTTFVAYKNGASVYSKAIAPALVKTSGTWRIGSDYRTADTTSETTRYKGYLSDFKIYATALSANDVLEMYKTRVQIARDSSLFINNVNETGDIPSNSIVFDTKMNGNFNGVSEIDLKNKFDGNIYFEPDGSAWVRIVHHNKPGTAVFTTDIDFANSVYLDANRWFNGEVCNYLNSWELLIKQKAESTLPEVKYRWTQSKNPMTAVYADVAAASITKNTSSGYTTFSHGGLYKKNANTYLCTNNGTQSNWWGAVGAWSTSSGGLPAWAGVVVKSGYLDLYVRIDNTTITNTETNFKSFNQGTVYTKNIIEY